MEQMDFKTIDYLQYGTPKQRKVFQVLIEHDILGTLAPYHPIVVGTIPLDIDIDNSDVDILLYADDLTGLAYRLTTNFSKHTGFDLRNTIRDCHPTLICQFTVDGLPFELYATDIETDHQMAYLHLIKESEILRKEGKAFADNIKQLKLQGIKTEPAFCLLLGLSGDPYKALLTYDVAR